MTLQEICHTLGIARVTLSVTTASDRSGESYHMTANGCNGRGQSLDEAVENLRELLAITRRQAEADLAHARNMLAKAEARIAELNTKS